MDALDGSRDWARVLKISLQSFTEKFHQDQTSGSLSRPHLSSKSLPRVLEERDVLDGAGDGVMVLKISQESFLKVS